MGFDAASTFAPGPGPMHRTDEEQIQPLPEQVQQSLLSFWPLDGSDPTTKWPDIYGVNALTPTGGVQTSKSIVGTGKCASFNHRTNQKLSCPSPAGSSLDLRGVFGFLGAFQLIEFPTA